MIISMEPFFRATEGLDECKCERSIITNNYIDETILK
jgi:hypothetical protein